MISLGLDLVIRRIEIMETAITKTQRRAPHE